MAARIPRGKTPKRTKRQEKVGGLGMEAEEKALDNVKHQIISKLDSFNVAHMRCLTVSDRQQVNMKREQQGHTAAASLLCELMVMREGWWPELLCTLKSGSVKQGHIADELEEELSKVQGRCRDGQPGRGKVKRSKMNRKIPVKLSWSEMKDNYMRELEQRIFTTEEKYGDNPPANIKKSQAARVRHFNQLMKEKDIYLDNISQGSLILHIDCPTLAGLSDFIKLRESGEFSEICSEVFYDAELAARHGVQGKPSFDISVKDEDISLRREELHEKGRQLYEAVEAGDVPEVRRLLADGADPNWENQDGDRPTCLYVVPAETPELVPVLVEGGADLHHTGTDGLTPLHHYCWDLLTAPYAAVIARLVQAGAPVNGQDSDGQTPLHYLAGAAHLDPDYSPAAALSDLREAAAAILGARPDLGLRNMAGRTAREWAAVMRGGSDTSAAAVEQLSAVEEMLREAEEEAASPPTR